MSVYTLSHSTTITIISCSSCGVPIALGQHHESSLRRNHKTFYCPNGHNQYFPAKSDVEKERERAELAEQRVARANTRAIQAQQEAENARRSAAAYKGQVTKLRKRVAAGICPVPGCRRTFQNVARHVEGQHATYLEEHPTLKEALQ
jgi:hypothetical protein